ncbi:AraC family transcriptional regulator [Streptomyces malaysiensis]|uniref:AraC family transcriptional regulator n=1 Tax=Streptomyces malaysiensis TaxID=92644 RepID=UPI001BE3FBD1|nr:AraC family transcriptional regulator [Streptomyces malaysiensis]
MCDVPDFDLEPYAGFDANPYVERTFSSWDRLGWRSLLLQRFQHTARAESVALPATEDLHLMLTVAGDASMETRTDGRWRQRQWIPGQLEMAVPGVASVRRYRSVVPLRTLQVHIPYVTVARTAEQLGGARIDYERMAAAVASGDPLVEHTLRSLGAAGEGDDLYAESAATFLAVHVLTRGLRPPQESRPGAEGPWVHKAVAMMRDRLGGPLTVADMAAEVGFSVYHFIRVFKDATGQTPHRYLTRLRVEEAQRLLRADGLSVAQIATRCGFGSPGSLSTAFLRHTGVRPSAYRNQ